MLAPFSFFHSQYAEAKSCNAFKSGLQEPKGNEKSKILNTGYKAYKPLQHVFVRPILKSLFHEFQQSIKGSTVWNINLDTNVHIHHQEGQPIVTVHCITVNRSTDWSSSLLFYLIVQ